MPILFSINRRMKEKGWKLKDLQNATGLSLATLSKIQNGYENTTIKSLALIARALGCGIKDLFEDPNGDLAILKNSKREE